MYLVSPSGEVLEEYAYDPWGRRRNAASWLAYSGAAATARGFTGHDPIDLFELVNMDGRVYDPRLGRFLSPDIYVQEPENTQSYNRYSYCFNNPLRYVDPTGWQSREPVIIFMGIAFYTLEEYEYFWQHELSEIGKIPPERGDRYVTEMVDYFNFHMGLTSPVLSNEEWIAMSAPGGFESFKNGDISITQIKITQTETYRCTGYYNSSGSLVETHRELISVEYEITYNKGSISYKAYASGGASNGWESFILGGGSTSGGGGSGAGAVMAGALVLGAYTSEMPPAAVAIVVGGAVVAGSILLYETIAGKGGYHTTVGQPWTPNIRGFDNNNRFPNDNPNVDKWIKYTVYGAGVADLGRRIYEGMDPKVPAGIGVPSYPSTIPVTSPGYGPSICPADATRVVMPLIINKMP